MKKLLFLLLFLIASISGFAQFTDPAFVTLRFGTGLGYSPSRYSINSISNDVYNQSKNSAKSLDGMVTTADIEMLIFLGRFRFGLGGGLDIAHSDSLTFGKAYSKSWQDGKNNFSFSHWNFILEGDIIRKKKWMLGAYANLGSVYLNDELLPALNDNYYLQTGGMFCMMLDDPISIYSKLGGELQRKYWTDPSFQSAPNMVNLKLTIGIAINL